MQIHSLIAPKRPGKKRVGRGGRRGKTAGRGTKGQKSRSGATIDPLFEGGRSSLIDRLKKVRGFKSPHTKRATISLSFLERHFEAGETVSREALIGKKLYSPKQLETGIKIVASGTISKKLVFDSKARFSEAAQKAIEQAGGTIAE